MTPFRKLKAIFFLLLLVCSQVKFSRKNNGKNCALTLGRKKKKPAVSSGVPSSDSSKLISVQKPSFEVAINVRPSGDLLLLLF